MDTDDTAPAPFQLQVGAGRENKFKNVFGCLEDLEVKHKSFEKIRAADDRELDEKLIQDDGSQEEMDTITSAFKKPDDHRRGKNQSQYGPGRGGPQRNNNRAGGSEGFPERGKSFKGRYAYNRKTPDYKLNPEKWTEYSLEDIDLSDSVNKQAAFAFLQERRELQEGEMKEEAADIETSACSRGIISFNKMGKGGNSKSVKDKLKALTDDSEEMESEIVDQNTGVKRKTENEETDQSSKEASQSSGFKSRKVAKRNIRSRVRTDDDSD